MSGYRQEGDSAVLSLQWCKENDLREGLIILYYQFLRMYLIYSSQTILIWSAQFNGL